MISLTPGIFWLDRQWLGRGGGGGNYRYSLGLVGSSLKSKSIEGSSRQGPGNHSYKGNRRGRGGENEVKARGGLDDVKLGKIS